METIKTPEQQLESLSVENENLRERLKETESERDFLEEIIFKEKIDDRMGLRKRTDFFIDLGRRIESLTVDEESGENLFTKLKSTHDHAEKIRILGKIEQILETSNIYVLAGDVSFLSFVNDESHTAGDELLRALGDAARESGSPEITRKMIMATLKNTNIGLEKEADESIELFRTGGDEVAAIGIFPDQESVEKKIQEIKMAFGRKEIDALKTVDLKPNVDIGFVHMLEAIRTYKEILNNGHKRNILMEKMDSPLHDLLDVTYQVADRRSIIQKGKERIELLVKLKREKPELYESLISFLRKGAFSLSDKEIDRILDTKDDILKTGTVSELNWEMYLLAKIQTLTDVESERSDALKKLQTEAIKKTADIYFFDGDGEK